VLQAENCKLEPKTVPMEMEKSHYVVTYKAEYLALLAKQRPATDSLVAGVDEAPRPVIVSITQGGFGQDIVDEEKQVKERFLEHLFFTVGIDIPRSADDFDRYFTIESIEELIDLDDEP
jgi:hypothetical protein